MFCSKDELEKTTRLVDYLDLAILRELVMDVVLLRLLVDPGDEENPSLDTPLRSRLSHLFSLHSLIFSLISVFSPAPCEAPALPPLGLVLQLAHHLVFHLILHVIHSAIPKLFVVGQLKDIA